MIHHVTLECERADADAHRAFWTALGFAPAQPPPALADRADWYERGGTQIHLLWKDAPVTAGHVAIVVDDLSALSNSRSGRSTGASRAATSPRPAGTPSRSSRSRP